MSSELTKDSALKLFQERGIKVGADKFAYRQGLFVLAGSGEGLVRILNNPEFRPKNFGDDIQRRRYP